ANQRPEIAGGHGRGDLRYQLLVGGKGRLNDVTEAGELRRGCRRYKHQRGGYNEAAPEHEAHLVECRRETGRTGRRHVEGAARATAAGWPGFVFDVLGIDLVVR